MNTIKEVLLSGDYDADEIESIANNGCSGGVSGFIYYSETVKFHDEHEEEIWTIVEEDTKDFSPAKRLNMLDFISSLNGSENVSSIEELKNLLVWYAVEKVAREIVDVGKVPEEADE